MRAPHQEFGFGIGQPECCSLGFAINQFWENYT